jgi:DNA-binding GntR family transcriptional regulator
MARSAAIKLTAEVMGKSSQVPETAVSAVNQVIESIKTGIRQGRYVPGQRLAEPDLMREFHVSRGSVREALRRLEADGLVQIELYRGASIRKMSRDEFIEAHQIRGLLEGFAACLAAERMDGTERRKLLELEQAWERGTKDWTYAQYNEQFHRLILDSSGHKQLPILLEQANLYFFRLQFHRIKRTPAAVRRSHLDHRRIVQAILKGDAKAAERAMREHVHRSGLEVLSAPEEFFT